MARPLAILFSLCLSLAALADGGVFLRVDTRANLPDQQAMIVYLNGLETLAIETRAKAAGEEIAWVVPLPAVPEVSPATTGTFPTLRAACAPRRMDVPWQLAASLGWLLMVVLCLFAPKGFERRSTFAACIFMLLFLCCLLVPTLGKARGGAAGDGVEVVDRSIVGNYEVSTVNAATGDSIAAWLSTNGFAIPADAKPALDAYTKEGWCFVACKLRRDNAGESLLTPHPLVFRFKTDRVVYPMRLTGAVNTGDLSLELYVFANSEAHVDAMETRFSQPVIGDRANFTINDPARAHPAIAALAQGATRLTMLRGTFTRDDMKRDITVDWRPPTDSRASVAGRQDAILLGVSIALAILIVACVVAKILQVSGRASLVKKALLASLLLGALSGGISYAAIEKAPLVEDHKLRNLVRLYDMQWAVWQAFADLDEKQRKPSLADVRTQIQAMIKTMNPDLEEYPIEEDSIGNYTLDERDGEYWLTLYWPHRIERQQLTGLPGGK